MTRVRIVVDAHEVMDCNCRPPQGGPDPSSHSYICPVAVAMHGGGKVVRVEEVSAGREAMETIVREAEEAGVEMGPIGQSPEARERLIEVLDANPGGLHTFLRRSRELIAQGGL